MAFRVKKKTIFPINHEKWISWISLKLGKMNLNDKKTLFGLEVQVKPQKNS